MYLIENISTAASSLHNLLNLCWEKTVRIILTKSLNVTYQVYVKQTIY